MRKLSMHELGRLSPDELKILPKTPIVVVYDNVRSALNVGSAFRTADAFRLERVVLCGITAQPPHKEIFKTALGATDTVAWQYTDNTVIAIESLRNEGYEVWAIEQTEGSIWLHQFDINTDKKYAFVLGNEVDGVSNAAIAACDGCIEIPQIGAKHSLNISVCTGIVAWHFCQKIAFV
jgi:23S rRNA (guanosine2251-2'-O)-methyltransferase